VAIVVETPPDLPLISIDRTLFSRALTNIIENALYAMPGGGRLAIAVRVDDDPSAAQDSAAPGRAVAAGA